VTDSTSTYHEPSTLAEALEVLASYPEADLVAGGTDLVVGDRSGKRPLAADIVAIHRVSELRGIEGRPDGSLRLGALVSHAELEASPAVRERFSALSDASALVGSPATRHVGTLGGNLANASPAVETGSPLLVFDATVTLESASGTRSLPLAEFLRGPGKTVRTSGELLTEVDVPSPPAGRVGSAYLRLEYRRTMEIAVVGAAALLALDESGRIVEGRLAITAVAPVCLRVPDAERALADSEPSADLFTAAAKHAAAAAKPIDDVRASADYRRAMVEVISRRALERALTRAREAS
jgi:CO/xanthine dehydrogenase FAD-binding subunit